MGASIKATVKRTVDAGGHDPPFGHGSRHGGSLPRKNFPESKWRARAHRLPDMAMTTILVVDDAGDAAETLALLFPSLRP